MNSQEKRYTPDPDIGLKYPPSKPYVSEEVKDEEEGKSLPKMK